MKNIFTILGPVVISLTIGSLSQANVAACKMLFQNSAQAQVLQGLLPKDYFNGKTRKQVQTTYNELTQNNATRDVFSAELARQLYTRRDLSGFSFNLRRHLLFKYVSNEKLFSTSDLQEIFYLDKNEYNQILVELAIKHREFRGQPELERILTAPLLLNDYKSFEILTRLTLEVRSNNENAAYFKSLLSLTISRGQLPAVQLLLSQIKFSKATLTELLDIAVTRGNGLELTQALLDKGANVSGDPAMKLTTPLFYAARTGDREVINLLLEKGAYKSSKDLALFKIAEILANAALHNRVDRFDMQDVNSIATMLRLQANPQSKNNGETALEFINNLPSKSQASKEEEKIYFEKMQPIIALLKGQ